MCIFNVGLKLYQYNLWNSYLAIDKKPQNRRNIHFSVVSVQTLLWATSLRNFWTLKIPFPKVNFVGSRSFGGTIPFILCSTIDMQCISHRGEGNVEKSWIKIRIAGFGHVILPGILRKRRNIFKENVAPVVCIPFLNNTHASVISLFRVYHTVGQTI